MAAGDQRELEIQQAINRALAAEREASATVARAEREAEARLARSREVAQRIRQRGAQRAATLHERYAQQRDKLIARQLATATADMPGVDPRKEKARIDRAVAKVAARLTGEEP